MSANACSQEGENNMASDKKKTAETAADNKKKALDAAIAKLEKDFGKGTVMKLGDPAAQVAVETIDRKSTRLNSSH